MESIRNILNNYGILGVQMLKADVQRVSATGKTANSISYEVKSDNDSDTLTIFAREFFSALETGRGPRKSTQKGQFLEGMLEYMQARGIGSDLTDKKRRQLARFLTLRINKEGDKIYRYMNFDRIEEYAEAAKAVTA